MATIDWPTTRPFQPARMTLGASLPRSGWQSMFTGQRQFVTHAAERLRMTLELPPCNAADAAVRDSYLTALARTGDWVRLRNFARPKPSGTMRGSPTVNGAHSAGATSLSIAAPLAGVNLLRMTQAQNQSPWVLFNAGINSNSVAAPDGTMTSDRLNRTATGNHYIAQASSVTAVAGDAYTFSVWLRLGTLVGDVKLVIKDGPGAVLCNETTITPTGSWVRYSTSGTFSGSPSGAVTVFIDPAVDAGSAGETLHMWGAQLERGLTATTYSGLPTLIGGDMIAVANQLIQVAYAGSTISADTDIMTVPLVLPLRAALSNGAAVAWDSPTGVFQLDADALEGEWIPGGYQRGLTLQFTEVF